MSIQTRVDLFSGKVAKAMSPFIQTRMGKLFLSIVLIGPLTFIPTIWAAWTEPNIDSLRTLTWPMMLIVNISFYLGVCYNGDWRLRLVAIIWVFAMGAVFIATLVR